MGETGPHYPASEQADDEDEARRRAFQARLARIQADAERRGTHRVSSDGRRGETEEFLHSVSATVEIGIVTERQRVEAATRRAAEEAAAREPELTERARVAQEGASAARKKMGYAQDVEAEGRDLALRQLEEARRDPVPHIPRDPTIIRTVEDARARLAELSDNDADEVDGSSGDE